MTQSLYAVYGAGGCGRGIMPLARQQLEKAGISKEQLVFVDDKPKASVVNGQRALTYKEFLRLESKERFLVLGVADSSVRERLAGLCEADNIKPWSVTAEDAVVMDDVAVGCGAVLSPFVTLTSNIRIGRYFHANLYSYVEHDCVIGDFVTFAPGVKCNGNVVIEDHAYIGAGAVIRQGRPGKPLIIGRGAIVGMGAVVTSDVLPGDTVIGNPARPQRKA